MKIRELKKALAELGPGADEMEIKVWLPGSRITLNGPIMAAPKYLMIEGNVDEGSALCS